MVDKNLQDFELAALDEWVELAKLVNEEASKNETKNDQYMLSNKCKYASSRDGDLRRHLKMHRGEKSNKCNQCDYASSQASNLRRHLRTHSVTCCRDVIDSIQSLEKMMNQTCTKSHHTPLMMLSSKTTVRNK